MQLPIRNWDRWQSYRSDRGQPPWIKVWRRLLRDPEWLTLTDAQRGHVISLWLLAADRGGMIPEDPRLLRQICGLESEPDIKLLIKKGFLDAKTTPKTIPTPNPLIKKGYLDANMTPTWRQGKPKKSTSKATRVPSANRKTRKEVATGLLIFLNASTGHTYQPVRANLDLICARLKEGYSEQDLRSIIAKKRRDWIDDDKMAPYLRPATLFNSTKCAQYRGELLPPDDAPPATFSTLTDEPTGEST